MTYWRSIKKALDVFNIHPREWAALAEDRIAWSETLRLGHPPDWQPPAPVQPLALTRPLRAAAAAANVLNGAWTPRGRSRAGTQYTGPAWQPGVTWA